VVYLDTGCLLKLHYPEPESAAVAEPVAGEIIVFTALHELEMVTAMQLKLFRGEGKRSKRPRPSASCTKILRQEN
jgi:hypothetical protein